MEARPQAVASGHILEGPRARGSWREVMGHGAPSATRAERRESEEAGQMEVCERPGRHGRQCPGAEAAEAVSPVVRAEGGLCFGAEAVWPTALHGGSRSRWAVGTAAQGEAKRRPWVGEKRPVGTGSHSRKKDPPRARGLSLWRKPPRGGWVKKHGRLSLGKPGDQGALPLAGARFSPSSTKIHL